MTNREKRFRELWEKASPQGKCEVLTEVIERSAHLCAPEELADLKKWREELLAAA